jgi:2-hydroxychromene-2-carboxylate isomerase
MKEIDFYLDFISPYAYLAFEKLPEALLGISYRVTHRPVLFAGLLRHHGQLGPAEIAPKRDWTYRQVLWLAHSHGVDLQMPASHPFNPLAVLRLAVACDPQGEPNRYVCEILFRHVWQGGAQAVDPGRLEALTRVLAPARSVQDPAVKAHLQANTEAAVAVGVFGVPSFVVDGRVFWGADALPMLRAYLLGDPWFQGDAWDAVSRVGTGVVRAAPR